MEQYFRAKKGLYIGIGKDESQVIEADLGLGANNPKIRYNATSDKWEYSNDGTTYVEITEIPSDVFLTGTNDMDDILDGATYVKTENNLTDALKTNYDSAYTHSTTTTGNPHNVTKTDVGLENVANADTTNADNISDGTTNAIITLTQETNFETAYSKSHDQDTDTGTSSDDFSIGDGTDTDKTISIDNGDANSPKLKYNASTNKWQYSNDGVVFSDIGSGGSGSAEVVYLEVNQVGHGFDNDFVYNNGTTWAKAQANSDATTATHFAIRIDDDNFQATIIGEVDATGMTDDDSQALTTNTYYFLSQTVAGKLATTEPTTGIKQVVMKTNTTNNATISIEIPFDLAEPSNLAYIDNANNYTINQVYAGTPTFTLNNEIPNKKYVDDEVGTKQDSLTFGIADTNSVVIDSASVATGEYAKFTANGLESRSATEVKTDLSLGNVENTALSTWAGTSNITTLGTITTGTWNGNAIPIANGGTGQATAQSAINALTQVSSATNEYVLTKDTSTGNAIWKASQGGGGTTLAKLQEIYGLLANQNGVNYTGTLNNNTITVHTTAASSKSFFNFSFTNTTTTAQTISLLVDDIVVYKEELNPYENRNLADALHQPYFVADTTIKIQSTSTDIHYNINVIDVLDSELTGFFMLVGNTTGSEQTLKTAGASTKIKLLGEVFSNTDTVNRTITTKINNKLLLNTQTIGVNQGCLAMLNQGKTINSSQTYKITSSSTNVNYLVFGYEG